MVMIYKTNLQETRYSHIFILNYIKVSMDIYGVKYIMSHELEDTVGGWVFGFSVGFFWSSS